jgi:thiol:disulfide interchange protein DsbG
MKYILLASTVALAPTLAFAAPSCAVPATPTVPASHPEPLPVAIAQSGPDVQVLDVSQLPDAVRSPPTTVGIISGRPVLPPEEIARTPALQRLASRGATLADLGTEHGLRTIFAQNGNVFQVFYLAPDGQAVVGGVMWDATGKDITRGQVAPIPGTIPTVKIGTDAATAPTPGSAEVPVQSALKAVAATTYGTIGLASAPRLWMFVDPLCAFSVRAMRMLQPEVDAGKVQLAVIPLSVLDYEDQGRSTPAAELMVSQPGDRMVAAWMDQQLVGTAPASAAAALHRNMMAAASMQLKGTPTFVWQKADGSAGRVDGLPADLARMIASIGR